MFALFHKVLLVLTSATRSQRDLARQIQYLKVENEVLRGKLPGRVTVTVAERERLKKYAQAVGSAIRSLATIVTPETVWISPGNGPGGRSHNPDKNASASAETFGSKRVLHGEVIDMAGYPAPGANWENRFHVN